MRLRALGTDSPIGASELQGKPTRTRRSSSESCYDTKRDKPMRMATGMRLRILAIPICSAVLALAKASFKPAEVASARVVQYPIRSIADGVVVLDVSLDSKGGVTRMAVVRDIASLTPMATSSVQSWRFHPASEEGELRFRCSWSFAKQCFYHADQ